MSKETIAPSMINVTTEQLNRYLVGAVLNKMNTLVVGSPGIGKSDIIEAVAKETNHKLVIFHPVTSDPVDFKGLPYVENGKAQYLLDDHLCQLINTDVPTICFFDDLGQAPAGVQAACFPAGSQVCTADGMANIEGVSVGDNVITDNGRPYEVIDTFTRPYNDEIFTIKAASVLPIKATAEHPFLVIEERKKTYYKETITEPKWKPAKDIIKGNYIGVPIIKPTTGIDSIQIDKSGEISRSIPINEDFARFLGYYVGNGCYVQHPSVQRVEITLNAAHSDKIEDLTGIMTRLFATRIFTRVTDNCFKIAIHDKRLGIFLKEHCGENAYTKRVPNFILRHINERLIVQFLTGYLATDGAIARDNDTIRGVQFTTSSLTLALQTQQLFARLNVLAGIKERSSGVTMIRGKEYDCAKSYAINCYNNRACSLLGVETTKKRDVVWAFIFNDIIWTQVRSVESEPFQGLVYNIEVAERHTYTVNNCIVHNCMQLLQARRINSHKVSDHVTFIAATNRRSDGSGVTGILEALKSRFRPILQLEPDLNSWIDWAYENDMPDSLIAFMRFRPDMLNDPKPSKEMVNFPCPRTVASVGKWVNAGFTDAPIIAGCAGDAFATEYLSFLKVMESLPDIRQIIKKPDTTPVPGLTEPATLYATAGMLAKHSSEDNFDAILTYAQRMPTEFTVLAVRDAIRLHPTLTDTKAFVAWAVKYNKQL